MAKSNTAQKKATTPAFPTDAEMREAGMNTLSSRIRHLSALGMSTADITRNVVRGNGEHPKYQHVRNVLRQPLKRPVAENANTAS